MATVNYPKSTRITTAGTNFQLLEFVNGGRINRIICCNPTITDAFIKVWLVPSAETLGDQHLVLFEFLVPAGKTVPLDALALLQGAAGDSVYIEADIINVNFFVSVTEAA